MVDSQDSNVIGVDAKEFVNSPEFGSMNLEMREAIMKKYLYKESRLVYDCLLYRNKSKCFSFNSKESIYARRYIARRIWS